MKNYIIATITSFLLLIPVSAQDQWEIVNEGIGSGFGPIDFINRDTGWGAGAKGIFKTIDGGENWVLQHEYSNMISIYDVDFYDDVIGWAIGDWTDNPHMEYYHFDLCILKTLDGGLTWFPQKKISAIGEIEVISGDVVYAIGYEFIIKSRNGGSSWEDITPSFGSLYYSACFYNADTGVVAENHNIFRTLNGGQTWDRIGVGMEVNRIELIDGSSGYFVSGPNGEYIYKTSDTFSTWSAISDSLGQVHSCYFIDSETWIAIENNSIVKSTDEGTTWKPTDHMKLNRLDFNGMHIVEGIAFLFYSDWNGWSYILKSSDQGDHWNLLHFSWPLTDVHFMNRENGMISGIQYGLHGHNTAILQLTENGGDTWGYSYIPGLTPNKIYFVTESVGFMSSVSCESVYYTSDGGADWSLNESIYACDMHLLNRSVGWMVDKSHILKTMNGGTSWVLKYYNRLNYQRCFNSLYFVNENRGYVVGDGGLMIKYSEVEGRETLESGTTLPLNKVLFIDEEFGWVAGGYNDYEDFLPILLVTMDGGLHWTEVPDLPYLIHDLHFSDTLHGLAVGEDDMGRGVILETFDSGKNWKVIKDSLSARLNALYLAEGYGWAVGDNGLLLKTKYTSTSIDRFMVFGDAHHYSPSPDFSQSMLYELTLAAIEEEVDFVFLTGDLGMQTFQTPEQEDLVLKDWRFVLDTLHHHNIRVYACRGNVDAGSREAWDSLFSGIYAFPQNGPEMEKNLTYAIEYDNLLFLSLDQYTDSHKINQEWLDSVLAVSAREHIFAAGHEPAFKLRNSNCMGVYPEDRNLFWESLTDAGAKTYFSGHDHFYDHTILDDGDSNPENDVHHVTSGTGGGSIFSDSEYDGDNGRWTPERLFHEEAHGYVLVEISDNEVEMTWKHRIEPNVFESGGDSYVFSTGATRLNEIEQGNGDLMNYPNPFSSRTIINYELSAPGYVELNIYDLSGRIVTNLVHDIQPADNYEMEWNAEGMEPGIYFCELRTGQRRQVIKMILIK